MKIKIRQAINVHQPLLLLKQIFKKPESAVNINIAPTMIKIIEAIMMYLAGNILTSAMRMYSRYPQQPSVMQIMPEAKRSDPKKAKIIFDVTIKKFILFLELSSL